MLQKGTALEPGGLQPASFIRPVEFHLGSALTFIGIFAALVFTLAAFYLKAKPEGRCCQQRGSKA
jgi:hypothetical protein